LNPGILVKKPGKIPEGHINSWFWERGSLKDDLPLKLPEGTPACLYIISQNLRQQS